jgi:flagellar basal-body rod protein FlgB
MACDLPLHASMIDPVSQSLEGYMDTLSARQKLVASNIANADTPGYKTLDLDFSAAYKNAVEGAAPKPMEVQGLPLKTDGNNVSLDREARMLAENALRFNVASSLLKSQFRTLKMAIDEGRNG